MAFNGPRKTYVYYLDDGKWTTLVRDEDNSKILGVEGAGAATEYNAASPPTGTQASLPANVKFRARFAWWQANDGSARRKLTIFDVTSDLWVTSRKALTIEGKAGAIVGRVGERVSF